MVSNLSVCCLLAVASLLNSVSAMQHVKLHHLVRMVCTKHGVTLEIRAGMSDDISKYGVVSFPTMD